MSTTYWQQIKENNKLGLQGLYEEFFDVLYSFGKYFHSNEAEVQDAIQNVFLRIWEKRATLNVPDHSKNYLMTAVRNELNQNFRKSKRIDLYGEIKDSEVKVAEMDWEETTNEEKTAKVNQAIEQLSSKNKEIIFLKYKENLTNEEIAEVLGINYQSVRNLLHRAIKQLRGKVGVGIGVLVFWLLVF